MTSTVESTEGVFQGKCLTYFYCTTCRPRFHLRHTSLQALPLYNNNLARPPTELVCMYVILLTLNSAQIRQFWTSCELLKFVIGLPLSQNVEFAVQL